MAFPLPDKPPIAVLPFTNMSEDASQEYFVDGMTEDLITDLSKISGLFVIARNSSFSYKGRSVPVSQVAEELGVRYVLEGSVRRAGDEVRINAQLIDATTGGHLWAERYDGTLENIFDLQDQVTEQIVAALAVSLTGEEQVQQARHGTENAAAHDTYLQGWARYKLLTPKDLAEAVPFFEESLRLDPAYAQAHAALASLYWDVLGNDWAFDLNMPSLRAEEFAIAHLEEALKNPTPPAHALQARMLASWDHTSLPEQDILALQWSQFDGEGLTVRQIKKRGDRELWIPLHPRTLEMLAATSKTSTYVVVSEETGRPYVRYQAFSRIFRKFRERAGIRQDLTFQDLRRTAMTEMGDHGATNAEIVAFSGHKENSRVLDTYIKPGRAAARNAARKRWGTGNGG